MRFKRLTNQQNRAALARTHLAGLPEQTVQPIIFLAAAGDADTEWEEGLLMILTASIIILSSLL